jgi:hypothetical protein
MSKYSPIVVVSFMVICAACIELQRANETWEALGPIKVRIMRKYSRGNDYYFFDALDAGGRWKRVMSVWHDANGSMPLENVRSVDSRTGYLFLVDPVAVSTDGGETWSVFNTSKYFNCGWDGCAPIKDVSLSATGVGSLAGLKRNGTEWLEYRLETTDFGRTWRPKEGR